MGKAHERLEKAEAKELAQKQRLIEVEGRRIEAQKRTVNGMDPLTSKLAKLEERERALNELHKLAEDRSAPWLREARKSGFAKLFGLKLLMNWSFQAAFPSVLRSLKRLWIPAWSPA